MSRDPLRLANGALTHAGRAEARRLAEDALLGALGEHLGLSREQIDDAWNQAYDIAALGLSRGTAPGALRPSALRRVQSALRLVDPEDAFDASVRRALTAIKEEA